MKTPEHGEPIKAMSSTTLGEELLDTFYVQMSELIDQLYLEVSGYTPIYVESFLMLRSNATKIFRNFIGDVRDLVVQVRTMDENMMLGSWSQRVVQGSLFDHE